MQGEGHAEMILKTLFHSAHTASAAAGKDQAGDVGALDIHHIGALASYNLPYNVAMNA
jgi:hypothetical protein